MSFSAVSQSSLLGLALSALLVFSTPALAGPMVIYTWTTTSEGFGPHVDEPTVATFEVPLSDVLSGVINQGDITDIQLTYPGLSFDTSAASSVGLDAQAFVNPTTGALIFHDLNQGLAVIASQASDPNTFLSITVDALPAPPSTTVADQFNALNGGSAFAGFPTAGFWTATFPTLAGGVPEPATWAMLTLGIGVIGGDLRRRKRRLVFAGGR